MAPPSGGVLVKNEIQSRKANHKSGAATASGTGSGNYNDDEHDQQAQQTKKRQRNSDDPYASLRTQLSNLSKNPNRQIIIPRPKSPSELIPPPPELVTNVQGSSAGAGSGEFHVYKQARRREMERTKIFEEQRDKEVMLKEFEDRREQMKRLDDQRTSKNRDKRRKRGRGGGKGSDKKTATDSSYNDAVKSGAADEAAKQEDNQLPASNTTATQPSAAAPIDSEINLTIIDEFAM
ncbi:hypothetical protein V1525DRAFT_400429 [Lipomyces kononenkoae]|uniref:Uncharacterized protein n=1 Tax=Lipomyces kononenkoae TaxID=34357 RepID=A0ACC3T791_LIPKO